MNQSMLNLRKIKHNPVLSSLIILCFVMFILPFYSVETYSIVQNTTSHLGAQFAPNAWIMNVTFLILGLACIKESLFYLKTFYFHQICLHLFGVGLIITGIFQHAPIIEGISYNVFEDNMHSIFASLVGFSFVLLAFSASFIESKFKYRYLDIAVALLATLFSIIMASFPEIAGIVQRTMFIMAFTWIHSFTHRILNSSFNIKESKGTSEK